MKTSANPAVIDAHLSDRDCLDLATTIVLRHPQRRIEFQNLVRERGWDEAAMVAAYDCQARSMRLRWWEQPPCVASVRGKDRAARLLRRMARRGDQPLPPEPARRDRRGWRGDATTTRSGPTPQRNRRCNPRVRQQHTMRAS
jgi:hypothetical protein